MTTVSGGELQRALDSAVGWASVRELGDSAFSVLLPSLRMAHDHVQVVVEQDGLGWRISDAEEFGVLAGGDPDEVASLLNCAGSLVEWDGRLLVTHVSNDDDLTDAIIGFARSLAAAPIVATVRDCIAADTPASERPEPAVSAMARLVRQRTIERIGPQLAPFLKIRHRAVAPHGFVVSLPLALVTNRSAHPRLVATFVDLTASRQAVVAAEKETALVAKVMVDFTIPKFVVVRGTNSDVDAMAAVYDRGEDRLAAVPEHDLEPVFASVREQVPELV